jgi:hypothetical protein
MGILDPLFNGVAALLDFGDGLVEAIINPEIDGEQASDIVGSELENVTANDEIAAALVDLVEEFVISDLEDAGQLTPQNVERVADQTEGGATAVLLGVGLASTAVEAASLGQVDKQTEYVTQALAGLGVADVTGLELEARISEGIMPALEAKVNSEHRAKFADLQDVVEADLRTKDSDSDYIRDISTYGIRPDQLDILEEVALNAMEFEELIETPAELGLVVPDSVLNAELDRSGYSEATKDFLRQVNTEIDRSNRVWQEKTAVDPVVSRLDQLVESGELNPAAATALLPPGAQTGIDALNDRFNNIQGLSQGKPSRSQLEGSFARGYSSLDKLRERLEAAEYDAEKYEGVVKATVLDELDGDLQEAVALGLVSENTYSNLCEFVGLDEDTTQALLSGQSFSDITTRRLQEQQSADELPTSAVQGIGEGREQALSFEGIDTLADLAAADVATVADATNVSEQTAEGWISVAQQATE